MLTSQRRRFYGSSEPATGTAPAAPPYASLARTFSHRTMYDVEVQSTLLHTHAFLHQKPACGFNRGESLIFSD